LVEGVASEGATTPKSLYLTRFVATPRDLHTLEHHAVADYLPKGCLICLELFAMNVALPQRCAAQGLFPGQVALRLYRRVSNPPATGIPVKWPSPT
jgi:hypothetical protein